MTLEDGELDYRQVVDRLTPELVDRFRTALELGRWPDGRPLTDAQKEHCMQAVITYEARYRATEERVGYIDRGHKGAGGDDDEPVPLQFREPGDGKPQ